MKVYLKHSPEHVGAVLEVYVTESGQKRIVMETSYGSQIDAEANLFEMASE